MLDRQTPCGECADRISIIADTGVRAVCENFHNVQILASSGSECTLKCAQFLAEVRLIRRSILTGKDKSKVYLKLSLSGMISLQVL